MVDKLLIVDDEPEMLQALRRLFTRKGHDVSCAMSGEEALVAIEETMFDLVISDMAMEDIGGLELLERVRATDKTIPFIIITGVGTIETAVKAIQLGAFHYITKPFKSRDMEILAQRALEYGKLHRTLDNLLVQDGNEDSQHDFIGKSKSIRDLMRRVDKVADSMAPVLIQGETGTGKSLLAERIHRSGSRCDKPFLTIDCGALTETLLESELFGHVKGAFTGAMRAKRGLLEEAQGGTVFLDEICEITPPTQVKLLRAIQEREIKPVGGNRSVSVDVRFISATSRDLNAEVRRGGFREELYYRLAVVPLFLPPLRERRADIPLLIDHFIRILCKRYRKKIKHIRPEVVEAFRHAPWKGNIRELANILERAVLMAEDDVITLGCLQQEDFLPAREGRVPTDERAIAPLRQTIEATEKKAIIRALNANNNNRSEAARVLGISRRTLYDKMAAYQIGVSAAVARALEGDAAP